MTINSLALVSPLCGLGISLSQIAVFVERQVFLITFEQQLEPFSSIHAGNVNCPIVTCGKAFWCDVRVKRVSISAVEDDSRAQLLAKERLEESKDHIEDLWLIHDVNAFDSKRHRILQPVYNSLGERWRKLPSLLKRQAVHVENHNRSVDLRFRLKHRCFKKEHASFEDLVETNFLVLPFFWWKRKS